MDFIICPTLSTLTNMIKTNLERIFLEIKDGNNLGEKIHLVGATKTHSADVINEAIICGLKIVAENKVQEFRDKNELILKDASQHFIGHLQTNKVKYLVGKVDLIQSVDSVHLAEEINRQAEKKNIIQDILIEINVGEEISKSGFLLSSVENAIKEISSLQNLSIKGLMAMLPKSDNEEYLISLLDKMRKMYDKLKSDGLPFAYLSIGTSGDYKLAINHGSNMIRLGRNIFGERNYGEIKNGNI